MSSSTYKHGIYTSEEDTSVSSTVSVDAGLPVFIGRAPVNLVDDPSAYVNKPLLAYSYSEAKTALGYSTDWDNYELCEAMYTLFKLYSVKPVIFINVLDPDTHIAAIDETTLTLSDDAATLEISGVLLDTVKVKTSSDGDALTVDTDYTIAFDDDGYPVITAIDGGALDDITSIIVNASKLDPSAVTADDVIGETDSSTGATSGTECLDAIYPSFGLVPGLIGAPGWSDDETVAAVLESKVQSINTIFKAMAVCDIDCSSSGADKYTEVKSWKSTNGYDSEFMINCWPKVTYDDYVFRLSTQLIGLMCATDADNDDIPYVSPSNKDIEADGMQIEDGTEVTLGPDQANYLNGQGIVTLSNITGTWRAWGNRTGIYPDSEDPKDAWIPVRRMFNWISNTLIVNYWKKVDDPTNRRLIENVVDNVNIWLNSLTAQGALLGGKVAFNSDENSTDDLIEGITTFHLKMGPAIPNRVMNFVLEYDTSYLDALFDDSDS